MKLASASVGRLLVVLFYARKIGRYSVHCGQCMLLSNLKSWFKEVEDFIM